MRRPWQGLARARRPAQYLRRSQEENTMFDLDRFVEDCRAAVAEDPSHKAVREVLARAVSEPAAVLEAAAAKAPTT